MSKSWSREEIENLKRLYFSGKPLSDIAASLRRTISAINKALNKFKIRRKVISNSNKTPKPVLAPKLRISSLDDEFGKWVSFETVCKYIKELGISLCEPNLSYKELSKRLYRIGHKTYTAKQVLLIANKNRAENHLPTYFVDEISW